jgi:hypothetical protein
MNENKALVAVLVPKLVKNALDKMARDDGTTLSKYVRFVFELHLKEFGKFPKPDLSEAQDNRTEYQKSRGKRGPYRKKVFLSETEKSVSITFIDTPEVHDRDYSRVIDPEALKPNENTKWMRNFTEE